MAQICAVSYVLLVDELERIVLALMQAAALARMLGSSVDMPDWSAVRADFDRALADPPKVVDGRDAAMLTAVGLRG